MVAPVLRSTLDGDEASSVTVCVGAKGWSPAVCTAYSSVTWPAWSAVGAVSEMTCSLANEVPSWSRTSQEFSGAATAAAPVPMNQSRTAGTSASDSNSESSGMSAAVTVSKSGSSLAGVKATISASVAPAFWQRQWPTTPPGPAAPPFSMTRVALKPISHPGSDVGLPTVTASPSSREAYAQVVDASRVSSPSTGVGGASISSEEQALRPGRRQAAASSAVPT